MKKTYITPEVLTVVLGTCQMMAESLPLGGDGGSDDEVGDGDFLSKENGKNIWDEEW